MPIRIRLKKDKPVEKKATGGTLPPVIPALSIPYISTTPEVANLTAIGQLEATQQAAQARLAEERARRMPNEEKIQAYFEKVKGLTADVKRISEDYQKVRQSFYTQVDKNPNWVFTDEGRKSLRSLYDIVSSERMAELSNHKTQFEEELKKAREKDILHDIYYDHGTIYIEHLDTGQVKPVAASAYYKAKEDPANELVRTRALTIGDYANWVNSSLGGQNGIAAFSAQMPYQKAMDELVQAFDKVGSTSSESVKDRLISMGITQKGDPIPALQSVSFSNERNTAQLLAAYQIAGKYLSSEARNAIKAELLKRGMNPDASQEFIRHRADLERQKRSSVSHSEKENNTVLPALMDKLGTAEQQALYSQEYAVDSSISNQVQLPWYSFGSKDVDIPIVGMVNSPLIQKKIQKAVPVESGKVFKFGGDDDTAQNDGKMVARSVLSHVVQGDPITTLLFTGDEYDPKTGKKSVNAASKGTMVTHGKKGTTQVEVRASQLRSDGKYGSGVEYFYDPDTQTDRLVTRRGFRQYRQLDKEGNPTNELYLLPVSLAESVVLFGTKDRSGQQSHLNFFRSNGTVNEQGHLLKDAILKRGEADPSFQKYLTAVQLLSNKEKGGIARQVINELLTEEYYKVHGASVLQGLPALKPTVTGKSVDTMNAYE